MFGKGKEDMKKAGEVIGFIGKGMSLEGRLSFDNTVRIDGHFKGTVSATGALVVGDGAYIEGNIKVGSAIVTGEVKGTLEASNRVELKSPAKMFGDIKTPTLIIGEGVIFEGTCVMMKKGLAEPVGIINYGPEERDKAAGEGF